MPAIVQILSLYIGDNPVAQRSRSAGPLSLPKDMAVHLARWLREGVLNRQAGFRGTVDIPGLAPLDVEWVAAGQTAGVAIWSRDGAVGCASLLLSGLEESIEREEILAALAARRLALRRTSIIPGTRSPGRCWSTSTTAWLPRLTRSSVSFAIRWPSPRRRRALPPLRLRPPRHARAIRRAGR